MAFTDTEIGTLRDIMRQAQAAAIRDVLSDEQSLETFWAAGLRALRGITERQAGSLMMDAVRGLLSKALLVVALISIIHALGGWAAVGKAWALFTGGGQS